MSRAETNPTGVDDSWLEPDDAVPMDEKATFTFPDREAWSSAAVKLLQGVVYHDDAGGVWNSILSSLSPLTDYFGRIGLNLVVDENDGLAWLSQPDRDDMPPEYESIPRLFRNVSLGFEATLLCIVLRDELQRSEDDLQNSRCVIQQSELLTTWKSFFADDADEVRLHDGLTKQLTKLEKLKFVRRFEKTPPSWEIRRILKARLPLESLKAKRDELQKEVNRRQNQQKPNASSGCG